MSAVKAQLLFTFASQPETVEWPVRRLGLVAGVSKSQAAELRQSLVREGILEKQGRTYHLHRQSLQEQLLIAYTQVLRPKLLIGRFRSPATEPARLPKKASGRGRGKQNPRRSYRGASRGSATTLLSRAGNPALFDFDESGNTASVADAP